MLISLWKAFKRSRLAWPNPDNFSHWQDFFNLVMGQQAPAPIPPPESSPTQEQIPMSFKAFIHDLETEASKIEKDVIAFLPSLSTELAVTSTVLTYAGPVLQTVVTLEAGAPAGALVAAVIADAQQDIIAAKTVISVAESAPAGTSLISIVQGNLSALLTDAKITNPTAVKIVTTVVNDLAALVKALTPEPAATTVEVAAPAAVAVSAVS